jgi:hypothetical protein
MKLLYYDDVTVSVTFCHAYSFLHIDSWELPQQITLLFFLSIDEEMNSLVLIEFVGRSQHVFLHIGSLRITSLLSSRVVLTMKLLIYGIRTP